MPFRPLSRRSPIGSVGGLRAANWAVTHAVHVTLSKKVTLRRGTETAHYRKWVIDMRAIKKFAVITGVLAAGLLGFEASAMAQTTTELNADCVKVDVEMSYSVPADIPSGIDYAVTIGGLPPIETDCSIDGSIG